MQDCAGAAFSKHNLISRLNGILHLYEFQMDSFFIREKFGYPMEDSRNKTKSPQACFFVLITKKYGMIIGALEQFP